MSALPSLSSRFVSQGPLWSIAILVTADISITGLALPEFKRVKVRPVWIEFFADYELGWIVAILTSYD